MKKILLLLSFFLFSVTCYANNTYSIKLTNYSSYTKYVKIKYQDKGGKYIEKEIKLRKNQDFWIRIHDPIFYLYSVSFHKGGKIRAGVHGKDGISFMRVILNGKMIYYQKIDCEMQLRGVFKTIHLGV